MAEVAASKVIPTYELLVIMGNICSSEPFYQQPIPLQFTVYNGAGMIFDNGNTILCGVEPFKYTKKFESYELSSSARQAERKNKSRPALYGIGGKREPTDANYRETAAREVIEELFGIQPTRSLCQQILTSPPRDETIIDGYVILRYEFTDLLQMLRSLRNYPSPYYRSMPRTVSDLILERRTSKTAEMTHLCLLPMVIPVPTPSHDLAEDIIRLVSEH